MDIRLKWYYRFGFLLLFLIVLFIFIKLQSIWLPILNVVVTIITPFIIAAFITYLLHPVIERIHESGIHRGVAVFIIYILFFGGIGFAVYKGLPVIIKQIKELAESIPQISNQYIDFVEFIQNKTSKWPDGIQERVNNGIVSIEQKMSQILTNILNSTVDIVGFIFTIAIIPFISFYMLKDYAHIKKAIWFVTPKKWRKGGTLLLQDIDKSLGSYIRGQILICSIIGLASTIFFWIFHMKYPLLLGIIIGITNIIPYFGPIIGAIPAVIIASSVSSKMIIVTIIIVFTMQFLEGNILSPLIVGRSLHIHPLVIIFALFTGEEIGGIMGMILSVPIFAILKVCLLHIRNHFWKRTVDSPFNKSP